MGRAPPRRQPRRTEQGADGRAEGAARGRGIRRCPDLHRERQRPARRPGEAGSARVGARASRRGRLRRDDDRDPAEADASSRRSWRRIPSAERLGDARCLPRARPQAAAARLDAWLPAPTAPFSPAPTSTFGCRAACRARASLRRSSSRFSAFRPRCGTGGRSSRSPSSLQRRRLGGTPSEGRVRWHWHVS